MKTKLLISLLAILTFVALASVALSQQSSGGQPATGQQKQPTQADATKPPQPTPVYKPPQVGAPGGRVGGGTRGVGGDLLNLAALAPNHVGLTTQAQPMLYWYLSGTSNFPLIFTLSDYKAVKPLVEKQIKMPQQAGIFGISLKEFGIQLEPGTVYRWFVSIVPDQERRARDLVAGAMIELAPPSEALNDKIRVSANSVETAYAYAEAGIWYDALMALGEAIDSSPGNLDLQQKRLNLLKQVGIDSIK
jgi:hypothetical protein